MYFSNYHKDMLINISFKICYMAKSYNVVRLQLLIRNLSKLFNPLLSYAFAAVPGLKSPKVSYLKLKLLKSTQIWGGGGLAKVAEN